MQTKTIGGLRVRTLVKRAGASEAREGRDKDAAGLTCVLLHGFGAPGDDLVGLAGAIDAPPGTVFVFPEAPHALEDFIGQAFLGDARAWWMIDIARLERAIARGELRDLSADVPEGLAAARSALSEMLDALTPDPETKLVLGGFSQGAMLSLDLALREPHRRLAGLVQLSGTMIAEREWLPLMSARRGLPVFQSHGEGDTILPFAIAERLRVALADAGLAVSFHPFDGPHAIPPKTLADLGGWLKSL